MKLDSLPSLLVVFRRPDFENLVEQIITLFKETFSLPPIDPADVFRDVDMVTFHSPITDLVLTEVRLVQKW